MLYQNFFRDLFKDYVNVDADLIDDIVSIPFDFGRKMMSEAAFPFRMLTDVVEYSDRFEYAIELPGIEKKDIKIELRDKNLIVTAEVAKKAEPAAEKTAEGAVEGTDTVASNEVPADAVVEGTVEGTAVDTATAPAEDKGKFIRKERIGGKMSRSFFVGDKVIKEEIKAELKDGILKITVPKLMPKKPDETKTYITID